MNYIFYDQNGGSQGATNTKVNIVTPTKNNSKNNNNLNSFTSIFEEYREKLDDIMIVQDYFTIALWTILLIINIIVITSFIVNPIRYSSEKLENIVSYNKLYYYIHILLLVCLLLYGLRLNNKFPLIIGDKMYNIFPLIIIFIIGWFIIAIFNSPPIKEDGSYKSSPKVIYKNKRNLIVTYTILLLFIIAIISIDVYKRKINPLGLLPYNSINTLYGLAILIVLVGTIYLLINSIKYNIKKYNLPKTWNR